MQIFPRGQIPKANMRCSFLKLNIKFCFGYHPEELGYFGSGKVSSWKFQWNASERERERERDGCRTEFNFLIQILEDTCKS